MKNEQLLRALKDPPFPKGGN